jgi:hypothetical protein
MLRFARFRCDGCRRHKSRRGRSPSRGPVLRHPVPAASRENVRLCELAPTDRHRASLGAQGPVRLQPRMVAEAPRHLHGARPDHGRVICAQIFGFTLPGCCPRAGQLEGRTPSRCISVSERRPIPAVDGDDLVQRCSISMTAHITRAASLGKHVDAQPFADREDLFEDRAGNGERLGG